MTEILGLFQNYHLICSFIGFFTAQLAKFILTFIFFKKIDFRKFFENGGMPSSHTSTVCALTVSLARIYGTDDPLFAISFIFSMVVIIDALGVRRATGENAKVLNKIARDLFETKTTRYLADDLKEYIGHKPFEVLIGAVIGIIIPLIIQPF